MRRSTRRRILGALATLMLVACGPPAQEEIARGKPVVITAVTVRDLVETIEATGELLAKHRAEVAAQVTGEVTQLVRDEGDPVTEGGIVLEIDPERRQLELARAQARVEEARAAVTEQGRDRARVEELARKSVASSAQRDQAQTSLSAARSRLHAAEADRGVAERALRDASVSARFAGLIGRRYVSVGEYVKPGEPLFELVSLDPIEVEFHLPEIDAGRVRIGQPIEVRVAPFPDHVFEAQVNVVSPTVDPRTRTLRVKALLANPEGRLLPGFFARADLGVARRPGVLTLPEEAVLQRADGAVVFVLDDRGRVARRVVEIGAIRDGWAEIAGGIGLDERVVLRGHADLIDGSAVVPRNPDGTVAASAEDADGAGPAPVAGGDGAP